MSTPHATVLFYDTLATVSDPPGKAYDKEWVRRIPGHREMLQFIPDIVGAMDHRVHHVLDIGCGTGLAAQAALSECGADARVTLVDASPHMLQVAQERLHDDIHDVHAYDFVSGENTDRVFPPRVFDLILCSYALTHLDDQHKRITLERLADSLRVHGLLIVVNEVATDRPGGWPVIERMNRRNFNSLVQEGRLPLTSKMTAPTQRLSRVDDLTSWMARGGLAVGCAALWMGSALLLGQRMPVNP